MRNLLFLLLAAFSCFGAERPNIIWIVGEDMGPELGCYGDSYARTPNLDRMAKEGIRFTRAFTHAPVCAPSRSGLITGRYPTSIGTHHMRSKLLNPPRLFTEELRDSGYYVAWPGKTDFNFDIPKTAFDSTRPWLNSPPKQPFFAFTNLGVSHESQIRATPQVFARNTAKLTAADRHDPAKAPIPPYHPDAPEIRRDLANYYDLCTAVDYQVGEIFRRLEETGLATNSIVIFFGDHGRGLPRSKRWVYDSGTHVPLIVWAPGRFKPEVREDLISFIDFAPTVLSLANVEIPKTYEGQVFLGTKRAPERKYIFSARDRMDERYDRIRTVRDKRYRYIRNFEPTLPYAQRISYMEEMPTMQVWRKWNADGKLTGPEKLFFTPTKTEEELYDTETDPHEIHNLNNSPAHRTKLEELRAELDRWIKSTGDLGAIPEAELVKRGLVADVAAQYEVRKTQDNVPAAGFKIETIAGTGKPGYTGDNGPATQAEINNPYGLSIGPNGDLYLCDMGNHRIRKIEGKGIITTVAGNGQKGWTGDNGPASQATLNEPYEIRFDRNSNIYFVEMRNHLIRRIDAKTGLISTIAGQGKPGFAGDGGPATAALFNQPHSIQFVGDDLWVCDIGNHRIRKIDLKSGLINTVGGTGEKTATRDGEILQGNALNGPRAIDVSGNTLWLALREGNAICKVDLATQRIRRVITSGLAGPKGITIAPNGWIIWADTESHSVRYLDPKSNTVHTLAENLKRPHGVYAHTNGNLYVGDSENHRILRIKLP